MIAFREIASHFISVIRDRNLKLSSPVSLKEKKIEEREEKDVEIIIYMATKES